MIAADTGKGNGGRGGDGRQRGPILNSFGAREGVCVNAEKGKENGCGVTKHVPQDPPSRGGNCSPPAGDEKRKQQKTTQMRGGAGKGRRIALRKTFKR